MSVEAVPGVRQRIIRNAAAVVGGRVANLVLGIVPSVLLARYLGNQLLGTYASLYAYAALFGWITTLGLDQIMIREAAISRERASRILGAGLGISLVLSAAAGLVAVLAGTATGYLPKYPALVALAVCEILLLAPFRLAAAVFQLELRQGIGVWISLVRMGLWAGAVAAIVLLHVGLATIVAVRLGCAVVEGLLIWYFAHRLLPCKPRFDWIESRQLLLSTWPMGIALLGACVMQRVDQVLIHAWIGDGQLGFYVPAVTVSELFVIFMFAFSEFVIPVIL
jgi:O-antigen/teichoic acid export membrane protein